MQTSLQYFSCTNTFYLVENSPKNPDPSFKMDLDFWDCFPGGSCPFYNGGSYPFYNGKKIQIWNFFVLICMYIPLVVALGLVYIANQLLYA